MSTSDHNMLIPQTGTVMMEPPALSSPVVATDKYDEIYAKYSAAIDMGGGLAKNNDAPSSSSSSTDPTSTVNRRTNSSCGMDPPEEYQPSSMQHKSTSSSSLQQQHRNKQHIYTSSSIMSQYNQGQYIPAPTASRDDDATVHSSAQYSVRSDSGGVGDSTSSSTQRHKTLAGSSHQQRDAIYTKLEALNAKSRALRGITYNTSSNANAGTTSSSSSYSPTSVMSSSPYVSSSSSSQPTSILGGRRMSDSESVVDSRLEYLTKQSLAYRNNNNGGPSVSSPMTSSYNNKKVTFESDYIHRGSSNVHGGGSMNNGISSSKGSVNIRYENSIPSSSAISITSGGASVTSASSNSITSATMNHVVVNRSSSSNSLAMKILSEKILNGYTMTRSHCPNCNMALLTKKEKEKKKKASFTFNPDGTLNMSSLRNTTTDSTTHEEEMCAFCPINNLRQSISRQVCKRVMATKLLSSGLEVGNGTTTTSFCTNCSSPHLVNAQGTSMECQVCPMLDTICVEIVREQSRNPGSSILETRACEECGCPELMDGEGVCKCIVCEVLNVKAPSYGKSSSVYGGSVVAGSGMPIFPEQQQTDSRSVTSSSLLGTSLVQSSSISAGGGQSVYDTSRSVAGGGNMMPSQMPFSSLLPAFPASPFKYNNTNEGQASSTSEDAVRIDLAKLQQQIQEELAKVKLSRKSLLIPSLGCQPIDQEGVQEPLLDQEIVKSPSITSGGSPIDLAKIQEALTKTIQRMDQSHSSSSPTTNLSRLQEQLKAELEKAKQSQAALERTIQMSNVTTSGTSTNNSNNIKLTRDELIAELDNAKQAQLALEKIIAGTNKIERTLSDNPSLAADDLTQELLAAASGLGQQSYSISQQEVDALGNLKEYIPEPSIFRYHNIPKVVVVYHVLDQDDCDPSVAAQSHHTKNLKRSERDPVPAQSSMFDCCGGDSRAMQQHQLQQYHDDETIETDEDDYTLNTMDDSRFDDYIHTSRSMVSSMREGDNNDNNNKEEEDQHQQQQRGVVGKDKGGGEEESCQPKSSTGRCIFSCFGCGTDDDVYTMVESNKRGIQVEDQQPQQNLQYHHELLQEEPPRRHHHGQRKSMQNIPYNQMMGQGDFSVGSSSIRRSYFREDSDRIRRNFFRKDSDSDYYYSFNQIVGSGSDFGSTCRVGGEGLPPKAPKRSGMTPPPPPPPLASKYSIDGSSDYDRSSPLSNQKMARVNDGLGLISSSNKRSNMRSPSPLSDWDSVTGSDFGSINRVSGSPYHPKSSSLRPPKSPNRFSSDNYSVTSELSDQSSVNRRVRFGGSPSHRGRNNIGHQQQLRALTEESIDNGDDMDSHQYSVDTEMLLNRMESATSGRQRQGLYSHDRLG